MDAVAPRNSGGRPVATELSDEQYNDIVLRRREPKAAEVLSKLYHISQARVRKIWKQAGVFERGAQTGNKTDKIAIERLMAARARGTGIALPTTQEARTAPKPAERVSPNGKFKVKEPPKPIPAKVKPRPKKGGIVRDPEQPEEMPPPGEVRIMTEEPTERPDNVGGHPDPDREYTEESDPPDSQQGEGFGEEQEEDEEDPDQKEMEVNIASMQVGNRSILAKQKAEQEAAKLYRKGKMSPAQYSGAVKQIDHAYTAAGRGEKRPTRATGARAHQPAAKPARGRPAGALRQLVAESEAGDSEYVSDTESDGGSLGPYGGDSGGYRLAGSLHSRPILLRAGAWN